MKKYFSSIVAAFSLVVLFASCKKYLQTSPTDSLIIDNYYKTEAELNNALSGVYVTMAQDGTFSRYIPLELEMGNDEGFFSNRNNKPNNPSLYDCQASANEYSDCWTAFYKGINQANILLDKLSLSPVADSIKVPIKGEALFLRSFFYFQLASRYGDVPLVLKGNTEVRDFNIARTPVSQVYDTIIRDMKLAEPLLADVDEVGPGHVSRTTADGIIARVYLKMAGRPLSRGLPMFDSARVWANKVVGSGMHRLNPDYKSVFVNLSMDKYDPQESMWEVEFYGNNTPSGTIPPGSRFACLLSMRYTGLDPDPKIVYGYGSYVPTGILYDIYNKYPSDTLRRDWNIPTYTYASNKSSSTLRVPSTPKNWDKWDRDCGKWKRDYETYLPKSRDWGPTNFPLLRYADVLLMMAECENELGDQVSALVHLNQVRGRALAEPVSETQTALLRQIIKDERARELCFEGLRKFDLIRWGDFLPAINNCIGSLANSASSSRDRYAYGFRHVSARDTLLPIPSLEISVNPLMVQNKGW